MSDLQLLAGKQTTFERMTIAAIARALLEGTDWLVQIHSGRGDFRVAMYTADGDSILGQIETLADTIHCFVVVRQVERVLVLCERPMYAEPGIIDIPNIPPYLAGTDDEPEPEPPEEPEEFCSECGATLFIADDDSRYCELCYEYR